MISIEEAGVFGRVDAAEISAAELSGQPMPFIRAGGIGFRHRLHARHAEETVGDRCRYDHRAAALVRDDTCRVFAERELIGVQPVSRYFSVFHLNDQACGDQSLQGLPAKLDFGSIRKQSGL